MNKNIISFLLMAIYSLVIAGCGGKWDAAEISNDNYTTNDNIYLKLFSVSPIKSGSNLTINAECVADNPFYGCKNVKFQSYSTIYESAELSCVDHAGTYPVQLSLKNITRNGSVLLECGYQTSAYGLSEILEIDMVIESSVTITPPSSLYSQIVLSPGQQQELTVTLPSTKSLQIGSKFTILESQQYLSFVGNESSCTINANESSCSVTIQANSNVTTTVNQTLRVITSEFPTESVFIKIVPNTPPPPAGPKYIFVSQSVTAGNFGGFDQANTICNNDNAKIDYPTQLSSGTFKALLNGNNATVIGTEYKNLADEIIATATTTNLVAEDSGLTNSIGKTPSGPQDGQYAWTGLARTGISIAENCTNWTNSNVGTSGTAGYVSLNTAAWSVASAGASTCDQTAHLYCVQQ